MVKSGSFKVSQGSTLGRIGSGVGQGLAEQLPKEIDRGRLSQGLKQFAEKAKDLSPLQQYAEISGIPGITPQMIQALPEILKQQSFRQGIKNLSNKENVPLTGGSLQSQGSAPGTNISIDRLQEQPRVLSSEDQNVPGIETRGALDPEAYPAKPYTSEQYFNRLGHYQSVFPNASNDELDRLVKEDERRYLAAPAAVREQMDFERDVKSKLDDSFSNKLSLLTQKQGADVFQDLSGEEINNLKRSMYNYVKEHPNESIENVSNIYAQKGLDLGKTNIKLNKLLNEGFIDKISSPDSNSKRIKSFQKIYSETNSEEQLLNKLKQGGFSEFRSSELAYPSSDSVSNFISKQKEVPFATTGGTKINIPKSQKLALDFSKVITNKDSILGTIAQLQRRIGDFDPQSFLDELRENQDSLGLTSFQKRELSEGIGSGLPTWADILYLPWGRK